MNGTCECGHALSGHQTGEGPWTGFCADHDCKCESPTPAASESRLLVTVSIEVPVWFPYDEEVIDSDPQTLEWDDLRSAAVMEVWSMIDPRIREVTTPTVLRGPGSTGRYTNDYQPFSPGIMLPLPKPKKLLRLLAPSGVVHGISERDGRTYCGKIVPATIPLTDTLDITCKVCLR